MKKIKWLIFFPTFKEILNGGIPRTRKSVNEYVTNMQINIDDTHTFTKYHLIKTDSYLYMQVDYFRSKKVHNHAIKSIKYS